MEQDLITITIKPLEELRDAVDLNGSAHVTCNRSMYSMAGQTFEARRVESASSSYAYVANGWHWHESWVITESTDISDKDALTLLNSFLLNRLLASELKAIPHLKYTVKIHEDTLEVGCNSLPKETAIALAKYVLMAYGEEL
jgi:hypothetical protein